MKNTFAVTALGILTITVPVQARIGETEVECTARYGQPLLRDNSSGMVVLSYTFSGFSVFVAILGGTSQAEGYSKTANGQQIEPAEIQRLLEANSGGRKWRSEKPTTNAPQIWKADDSSRIAFYDVGHTLNVRTAIFEEFANRDDKKDPFSTRGF